MTKTFLPHPIRAMIAAVVVTTMAVIGFSGPAQAAGWYYTDSMEVEANRPEDRFTFESDSRFLNGEFIDLGITDNNTGYAAELSSFHREGSWVGVGQDLTVVPVAQGRATRCQFNAWVYAGGGMKYNIEVIDPSTWTYIALKPVTQPVAWQWGRISTPYFNVPRADVYLRVSFLVPKFTAIARVDDFHVACTY